VQVATVVATGLDRGQVELQHDATLDGLAALVAGDHAQRGGPHAHRQARGGILVTLYFDENFLNMIPAAQVEGMYSCLDYYQGVTEPFSQGLLRQYNELYPGHDQFTAGSACSGLYRGLRLWHAAVTAAGTLEQGAVIRALNHATIAQGPGGPAAGRCVGLGLHALPFGPGQRQSIRTGAAVGAPGEHA